MKAFLAGVLFLVLLGVVGFFALRHFSKTDNNQQTFKTAAITRTGVLQKSTVNGADFSHVIMSGGQSWGVTSYSVNLDQYVGKKVEATGQNSGTTLYIDTIKEVP